MRGSLVHDSLYQLIRMELLPQSCQLPADDELYQSCRQDDMSWFRASYVRKTLKHARAAASNPKNKKKTLVAP